MYRGGYLVEIEDQRGLPVQNYLKNRSRIWEIKKQEAAKKG